MRADIPEGGMFPDGWFVWGDVVPFSVHAPLRRYYVLALPCFSHQSENQINKDALISRWRKLHICVAGTFWQKRFKWDFPRAYWKDTEDAATNVLTEFQRFNRHR